jgi:pimeloyl-ACP methyl ester carboxylesterase
VPEIELSPGLCIHYIDIGPRQGQSVLLLHGLGATGESWGLQFPALQSAGYRAFAPDARGFGRSSYPGRTSVSDMAADMASLLEGLNALHTHVVGISMGGTIALQLALDYPHLVDKLVLVNTFAQLHPENPGVFLYFLVRFILLHTLGMPTQARAVARRVFPREDQSEMRRMLYEQILQADPRAYRASMRALARFDVHRRLKEIITPTLIITGDQDTTVKPESQRRLAESIPGAAHVIVAGAGHAVIADRPAIFNRLLLDFLAN